MDEEQEPYRCIRYSGSSNNAMALWKELLSDHARGAKAGSAENKTAKIYSYTKPLSYTICGHGVTPFQTTHIEDKGCVQFDFVFAKNKNKRACITVCLFLDTDFDMIKGEAEKSYKRSADESLVYVGKKIKEFGMRRLPEQRRKRKRIPE